jgi:TonB family protein
MIKNLIFTFLILTIFSQFNIPAQTPTENAKITKGVINGAAISLPKPEYPAAAQAVKASGAVNVRVLIDEQGNVVEAEAVSGHPFLRQAAEQAARMAKFKPTTLKGEPVKVSGVIVYNFVPSLPIDAEDKKYVWAFGFFLTFLEDADAELLKEMGDELELEDILREISKEIPDELSAEKPLFQKLSTSKGAERQQAARDLTVSFKKYFAGEEITDYEIGQAFGNIITQLLKKALSLSGKNFQWNEAVLKSSLAKLKESLKNESSNITPETLKLLKELSTAADSADLSSEETIFLLFQKIEPIFETFDAEQKVDSRQ